MLNGVDISQFQGNVDFNTLKQNEAFVMIRANFGTPASGGSLNEDADFQQNRDGARASGILHGFYHYAYPEYNTPEAEADFFASLLSDLQENEILALDWEESYNGNHVDWVKRFLDRLSSHFNGYKPLVYMNYNEATHQDWSSVISANYGCWLADWDGTTSQDYSAVPWAVLAIKQYADNASVPGISGKVDADIFYGDGTVFDKYGYQKPAVATPQPTTHTYSIRIKSAIWQTSQDLNDAQSKFVQLQDEVNNQYWLNMDVVDESGNVISNVDSTVKQQIATLTNNLSIAENTINVNDSQKIKDLETNIEELTGKVSDYEDNVVPEYEKQIAQLKSELEASKQSTTSPTIITPTPLVNDPNTSIWEMEIEQALKTIGGFIPYLKNRLFHK